MIKYGIPIKKIKKIIQIKEIILAHDNTILIERKRDDYRKILIQASFLIFYV